MSFEKLVESSPIELSLKILAREIDQIQSEKRLEFLKMYPDVLPPVRAHSTDSGWDIYAYGPALIETTYIQYNTGLKLNIPEGYWVAIFPRSSVSKYDLILANSVGVIDQSYKGEILVRFKQTVSEPNLYANGERIAQLVLMKKENFALYEVSDIGHSERNTGGFGSTGK